MRRSQRTKAAKGRVRARKRPQQERSRETVTAILSAAAHVFAHRGYANTTTNHIAARAGVSIGSLYQYFPSKDAILLALAERHIENTFAVVLDEVREKRQAPIPELLRALVDALVRAHQTEPRLHQVIFAEAHPDAEFRRRLDELDTRAIVVARDLMEERCAELAIGNPEMASFIVVQVLEGVISAMAMRYPDVLANASFREELVRLLEAYVLGARTPRSSVRAPGGRPTPSTNEPLETAASRPTRGARMVRVSR